LPALSLRCATMGQSECSLSLFSVTATLPSTAPRNPSHSLADTHTRATRRARTRVTRANVRLLRNRRRFPYRARRNKTIEHSPWSPAREGIVNGIREIRERLLPLSIHRDTRAHARYCSHFRLQMPVLLCEYPIASLSIVIHLHR